MNSVFREDDGLCQEFCVKRLLQKVKLNNEVKVSDFSDA